MSDPMIFSVLLVVLLGLLALGVWVAVALIGMALVALVFFSNAPQGLVLATTLWGHSQSWPLAALPLFILMGEILLRSRLSQDMFSGLAPWLGRVPGRLLHVNILGCAIFAAVSGSSAATAATIGRMSVPELTRRGYSQSLILGTLAGSATLGLLIPPSIILIVYGVATEQSIARLFVVGILPGLMLVGLFAGYVAVLALRNPAQFPADGDRLPLREKLAASRRLIPVMLLIAGVIGTIYTGVASPTDAAAIGVVLLLVLAVSSGGFGWDALSQVVGIDPLWFGIYLVLVVEMSQITPPVGFNLFVIQGLTGIDILRVARAAFPFFLLLLLGVVLITVFPQIVTVLPNAMGR